MPAQFTRGVDPAECLGGGLDRRCNGCVLGNVQMVRDAAAAGPGDLGCRHCGAVKIAIEAGHPHPVAGQMQGGSSPDAAARADHGHRIIRTVEIVHVARLP
jgi:hypothetical protein